MDMDSRHGEVDLLGGWTPLTGPFLRGEGRLKFNPWLGGYGYGQLTREGPEVGVGVRFEVDW